MNDTDSDIVNDELPFSSISDREFHDLFGDWSIRIN